MSILKEAELRELLTDTLNRIGGNQNDLPKINDSSDHAIPFIEIGRYGYEYVCQERGEEIFRKLPYDTEELLYLVFSDITNSMARKWEIKNRIASQDSRIIFYAKKIELMFKIKEEFAERVKKEMEWHYREVPLKNNR